MWRLNGLILAKHLKQYQVPSKCSTLAAIIIILVDGHEEKALPFYGAC